MELCLVRFFLKEHLCIIKGLSGTLFEMPNGYISQLMTNK